MTNRTLSCYEVAWNMHTTGSHINQICQVVNKDRSTIYRWLKGIKLAGIRKFIERKKTAKHRRPSRQTSEYVIQKIVNIRNEFGWCQAPHIINTQSKPVRS